MLVQFPVHADFIPSFIQSPMLFQRTCPLIDSQCLATLYCRPTATEVLYTFQSKHFSGCFQLQQIRMLSLLKLYPAVTRELNLVVAHACEKYSHNSATVLSTGSQFILFYCLLNADSFELWQVAMNNVQANLH